MNRRSKILAVIIGLITFAAVAVAAGWTRIPQDLVYIGSGTTAAKTIEFDRGTAATNIKLGVNASGAMLWDIGNSNLTWPTTDGSASTVFMTNGSGAVSFSQIVNASIDAAAAISYSKLAAMTGGSILMGNGSNLPTVTALTGDVTLNSSGVTAIGASKVTSSMIVDGTIVNIDLSNSAAVAYAKLAPLSTGQVVLGNAGTATATTLSGDVTVGATGVTAIGSSVVTSAMVVDGTLVNADINASAGIVGSKLANPLALAVTSITGGLTADSVHVTNNVIIDSILTMSSGADIDMGVNQLLGTTSGRYLRISGTSAGTTCDAVCVALGDTCVIAHTNTVSGTVACSLSTTSKTCYCAN